MLNTPLASDLIRKGEVHELKSLMARSTEQGMQTFDQALFDLYKEGQITYQDALAHADSPNDLRLMIKMGGADAEDLDEMSNKLTMADDDDGPAGRGGGMRRR